MQNTLTRTLANNSLWLALLLHLLFLMMVSLAIVFPPNQDEKPGLYIPSYAYQEPKQPAQAQPAPTPKPASKKAQKQALPPPLNKKAEIAEQKMEASAPVTENTMSDGRKVKVMNISKNTEPVHLIGDEKVDKPLLVLLGKALTAKLKYPQVALDFGVKGIVGVGFTLNPDGTIINASVVQSSGAGILDKEALRAVNATSPVKNVDPYLSAAKYLVVGIIFG